MDSSGGPSSSTATDKGTLHSPTGVHEMAASEYLSKHRILELFENLTSALVYEKPEDPRAFAKLFIEHIQLSQNNPEDAEPPMLVNETNIESIFSMLDITKTGYITRQQYLHAMTSMGLKQFNKSPSGGDFNKISLKTFSREANMAIKNGSSTFYSS
jgi:hypothetical protein